MDRKNRLSLRKGMDMDVQNLINAKKKNLHFTFPFTQVLRDKDQKQDDDE